MVEEERLQQASLKTSESESFAGATLCVACGRVYEHPDVSGRCTDDGELLSDIPANPFGDSEISRQYQLISVLGVGGWGVVFKALQRSLNRLVAIKMLHAHLAIDPDRADRFKREADVVSKLNHPNITTVHDFGVLPNGQPFLVLEYLPGMNLDELMQAEGALSPAATLDIIMQVCDGLQAAHEGEIVHRDLKPSNIRLVSGSTGTRIAKIMDFGLARLTSDTVFGARQLTHTGQTLGTPAYMSPEQCRGEPTGAASDIYSLGCIMYEMLTGAKFADGASLFDIMHKHVKEPLPDLAGIPSPLAAILRKCLAKAAGDRYQSVADLKRALAQVNLQVPAAGRGMERQLKRSLAFGLTASAMLALAVVTMAISGWKIPSWIPLHLGSDAPAGMPKVSDSLSYNRKRYLDGLIRTSLHKDVFASFGNGIDDADFAYIFNRMEDLGVYLSAIKVHNEKIGDASVVKMLDFPKVSGIELYHVKVTDAGVKKLSPLWIQWLGLSHTDVTGSCFASGFAHLKELYLVEDKVTRANLPLIARLPSLQILELNYDYLTDADMPTIAKAKNLVELGLEGNEITDEGLTKLKSLPLQRLSLTDTLVRGPGLAGFDQRLLTSLSMPNFNDRSIQYILRFQQLKRLAFDVSRPLTAYGLRSLAALKNLQVVAVSALDLDQGITDDMLPGLAAISSLQELELRSNLVTESGLMSLSKLKLKKLRIKNKRILDHRLLRLHAAMPGCDIEFTH